MSGLGLARIALHLGAFPQRHPIRTPPLPKPPRRPVVAPGLPDREAVARFIGEAGETDLNAIARHFGLKGADRRALRFMLRDMQEEGGLGRRGRKGVAAAGSLPPVGVVDVVERDADGDLYVRLAKAGEDAPAVRLTPGRNEAVAGAPGLGDRLLVHFETLEGGVMQARLIKRLGQSAHRVLGVVRKGRREVRVEPVDRRSKESLVLVGADDLRDGDLVLCSVGGDHRGYGPKRGKLLEVVGREDQPRAASLIALHTHAIPTGFPEAAEAEADAARPPTLAGRTDLRDLPLITIDPVDARDHDDAVYAHPDEDPKNPDGWVVWVAIADVAAYVRPGSQLDRTAWDKGNSVYFPDRVEPMLPERLSAGLCSLREGEDRACMAVRMVFDTAGTKTGHRFVRGLMRSAAKLSYEQAQAAIDGLPDDATGPLLDTILKPLWAAYRTMKRGRDARSPLAIESMERRILLSPEGEIVSITPRASLEAHKLIEEMMVQANVCAAETLEARKTPLIYRVHDTPSQEKVFALADFLGTIAMSWNKGEPPVTARFNRLLDDTRDGPHAEIVNEVVLRTQMQAHYSPDNIGHFGLNLTRYAHFTSPIRRYADLVVHRALIRAEKLGDDGLTDRDIVRLQETAEHITAAERRAMAAERDATDRYVAAYLSEREGAEFEGRITGVTRFGLFVRLDDTGADGLVPVSSLGDEYFIHDDRTHALVGERSGRRWRLGARVSVRLREATPLTGGLLFDMLSEPDPADPNAPRPRLGLRGRGGDGPVRRTGGPRRGGAPKGVRKGKRR
jgi:ribonuclease R